MIIVTINLVCFCIITVILTGLYNITCGFYEKKWPKILTGIVYSVIAIIALVLFFIIKLEIHIPAEPLAYNQTQTIFTTDEGTYLADGLYPDGTYLLTVDGKDVLVVWQAVESEEVGLG